VFRTNRTTIVVVPNTSTWTTNWDKEVTLNPASVPILVAALKRDKWIGEALYRKWLWPKLPPAVQQRLPTPTDNPGMRGNAASVLGNMGSMAKSAIPALIRALREDEDIGVRSRAADALGGVADGEASAIAALIAALNDSRLMGSAAWALGSIGRGNKDVIAALRAAVRKNKNLNISTPLLALDKVIVAEPTPAKAEVSPP